jgi:4a-hydroxytetrahydrobiopterin dehydratase
MEKLGRDDVETRLAEFPDWALNGEKLQRTFKFEDFPAAIAFVHRVADLAEHHQHHPDIMIRSNKVTLTVSTHDAGGLTEADFELAAGIGSAVVVT